MNNVSDSDRGRRECRPGRPRLLAAAVVILAAAACSAGPAAPGSNPPSPTSPPAVDAAGFAAATCTANSEFGVGFGSPDGGFYSVAWKAFVAAVQTKDPTQLDMAAAAVLLHLEAARVATARGATWAQGAPANAEFTLVLVALEKYIGTVRAARAEPTVAAQAANEMETVWPHYLAYLQLLGQLIVAKSTPLTRLPC